MESNPSTGFQGVSNCYVFKSRLQEYAQKVGLPTPVYETIKEGPSHEPSFRSSVIVNDVRYDSLPGFFNRKAAEQSAAEVALMELSKSGKVNESISQPVHETGLCKNLLQEYAQKMNYAMPLYACQKEDAPGRVPHFSCTVEIGGIRYIGAAARTKKEAEIKAARTALLAIQSSTSELHSKAAGNSQLTVIPCRKRAMETASNHEETVNLPKAKKARFKKKMSKKKPAAGNIIDHSQDKATGNSAVGIDNPVKSELLQTDSSTLLSSETSSTEGTRNIQDSKPENGLSEREMPSEEVATFNSENGQLKAVNSIHSNHEGPAGNNVDHSQDKAIGNSAVDIVDQVKSDLVQADSSTLLSSETLSTEEMKNPHDSKPDNGLSEREMPSQEVALAPQDTFNSENVNSILSNHEALAPDVGTSSIVYADANASVKEADGSEVASMVNNVDHSQDKATGNSAVGIDDPVKQELVQTSSSTPLSSETLSTQKMRNLQDLKPYNDLSEREMPSEEVALAPRGTFNSENGKLNAVNSIHGNHEALAPDVGTSSMVYADAAALVKVPDLSEVAPMVNISTASQMEASSIMPGLNQGVEGIHANAGQA